MFKNLVSKLALNNTFF